MRHDREGRDVFAVMMALVVALVCSVMVRNVTAELNDTVGRAWPFSLVHCAVAASPGCSGQATIVASRTR